MMPSVDRLCVTQVCIDPYYSTSVHQPKQNEMIEPDWGNNVNPAVKIKCVPKWASENHHTSAAGNLETHGSSGSQNLQKSTGSGTWTGHFQCLPDIFRWTPSLALEAVKLWW